MPYVGRKPDGGPPRINWHHPHTHGLVSYMLFWEGSGLSVYDVVSGKTGTLTNSPTWGRNRSGNGGYGLTFANASSTYIDAGNAPNMDMDVFGSLAVCASTYYATRPNFTNYIVACKGNQWCLDIEGPNNSYRFYISNGGGGALWSEGRTAVNGDVRIGGGSYNGGSKDGYIAAEGKMVATSNTPFAVVPSSATATRIGLSGGGASGMTGDINFVAIWNRAVPPEVMVEFQRKPYACLKGFNPAVLGSTSAAPAASNIWMLFTEFPTLGYVEG